MENERPVGFPKQNEIWGSDAIAAMLRALDIPYIALNPGASFRGLHDSLVNYLGNERPQLLLCLHEESAVAIAHGYAKASGRMMGVALHSNVGLMHATMAIFNAWCDRVPMLILGATGPWDAARRRPWIDWIHTSSDQGALVRDYTKWDNQPASIPAAYEALLRAAQIANTAPRGPTCNGCRVGKVAPVLRSVITLAPSFSARATRARQVSMVRLPRPTRMTGAAAPDRTDAARAISSGAGRGDSGAPKRVGSGSGGRPPSFDSWSAASRLTYVGPHGAVVAICAARRSAS